MTDIKEIYSFLNRRFPDASKDKQWVSGNCFYFAIILKSRFPEGYIVYDTLNGHFLFLYRDHLIDAVHTEYLGYSFTPTETNYTIKGYIVVWDFFPMYDSLQYSRIIRDCIQ